jgi:hypothetical protein
MDGINQRQRRHVRADDNGLTCPYDPRHRTCRWSDGVDCYATMEKAKDCPLNGLDDAAACEEACLEMGL